MDKINISSYLKDLSFTEQTAINTSGWYEVEYKQLKSTSSKKIKQETLDWLYSQGWGRDERRDENAWDTRDAETEEGVVYLQATMLDSQLASNDLIEDIVDAYNEGRTINDTRYDEILALYQAHLDEAEDQLNAHETREDAVYTAIATEIDNFIADFTTHETDAGNVYDDWGTATTNDITDRYDARVAAQKQDQIDRGWYNSTRWNQVETSIDNEEDKELLDLAQRKIELRDALKHRLYGLKAQAHDRLVSARTRLDAQLADQRNRRVMLISRIIQATIAFAERRTDSYPDLAEVTKTVKDLASAKPAGYKTP